MWYVHFWGQGHWEEQGDKEGTYKLYVVVWMWWCQEVRSFGKWGSTLRVNPIRYQNQLVFDHRLPSLPRTISSQCLLFIKCPSPGYLVSEPEQTETVCQELSITSPLGQWVWAGARCLCSVGSLYDCYADDSEISAMLSMCFRGKQTWVLISTLLDTNFGQVTWWFLFPLHEIYIKGQKAWFYRMPGVVWDVKYHQHAENMNPPQQATDVGYKDLPSYRYTDHALSSRGRVWC